MMETLDRDTIVRALDRLSQILGDRGITGEVCRLGGTVMVLAFKADFWNHLADFLDQFYLERRLDMLQEEPARLAGKTDGGDIADAYLAATAVSLARSLSMVPPSWARHPDRTLHRPWFASAGPAIRGDAPPGKPRALPRTQPLRQ